MGQPTGALPVGSQISGDYQYEYRGVLIGSGTPYTVEKATGLLAMSPVVQYHSKAQAKHGIFYAYEVLDARTIEFDLAVHSEGDMMDHVPGVLVEGYLDDLNGAFQVPSPFANLLTIPLAASAIDDPLLVKRPGKEIRQIFCHTIKKDFPSTSDVAMGLAKGSIQLLAGDPIFYSLVSKTKTATVAAGAYTSPSFTVTNDGNFPSLRCTIRVTGPGGPTPAGPWIITNVTSGQSIRLNMVLGGTDYVDIDLQAKTIIENGTTPEYIYRRSDSQWFTIGPGDNVFQFTRPTNPGVSSSITVTWYDAWDSA